MNDNFHDGSIEPISFRNDANYKTELVKSSSLSPTKKINDLEYDIDMDHYEHRSQCSVSFLTALFFLIAELSYTVTCAAIWGSLLQEMKTEGNTDNYDLSVMWALDFFFGLFGLLTALVGILSSLIILKWYRQVALSRVYIGMLVLKMVMRVVVCIYSIVVFSNLFYVFILFAVVAIAFYAGFIIFSLRRSRTIREEMTPLTITTAPIPEEIVYKL
ncbi:voltage-dependent P/Q-type calcium channel subunit alpha [Acrasis kona]|uniref:Voltage-dependent P/Q-type calcium channel subunit alpha n=1 Tax=Acrasis kona TaxID=1008807 RepID=A0AAW2Z435_9EUKA